MRSVQNIMRFLFLLLAVVTLFASAPVRSGGTCEFAADGASLSSIRVLAPGEPEFEVEVEGVSLVVRPTRNPDVAKVEVRGSISFSGTSSEAALRPHETVNLAGGAVRLGSKARITRLRMSRAGALIARVNVGRNLTLPAVALPCLGLEADPRRQCDDPEEFPITGPDSWLPRAKRLTLSSRPHGGARIEVAVAEPAMLPFSRVGAQGEKLLVEAAWSDGTRLSGWVARGAFLFAPNIAFGSTGGRGRFNCSIPTGSSSGAVYAGPAAIAEGAVVFASPGSSPWARFERSVEAPIVHVRNEPFARVIRLPDVRENGCDLLHAYVAASDVSYPQGPPQKNDIIN